MSQGRFAKIIQTKIPPLINKSNGVFAEKLHSSQHYSNPASTAKEKTPLPTSEIPGFKIYPIIGSSLSLFKNFDNKKAYIFWQEAMKKFGPITKLKIPFGPLMIAITDPVDIEKMYRVTSKNPIRQGFNALKKVRHTDDYFQKKGGLLVENFEEWWRVRSRVQAPMMRPKNLIKYLPQMDEVALCFMDRIAQLQDERGEMPANFLHELYKWALESVGLVALSRRFGCFDHNLSPGSPQMLLLNSVQDLFDALADTEMNFPFWRIYPTASYKKVKESHDLFLKMAEEAIRETMELLKTKETDELTLMETLLRTEGLTPKDVVTMMIDMLFAGIDTTSHTLAFTLYCLAKNPKSQKLLQEEVDRVLGSDGGPLTEAHLASLSYLKHCVKEAMRLFPVVPAAVRTLEEDIVLSGYHVPKGVQVLSVNFLVSLDEKQFTRANEFLPERWSREKPFGPINPYASLPFSHGPRMCIGRRIAEQELYTFLARAVQRYEICYKYGDIGMYSGIVSIPSEPLRFEFKERGK